MPDGSQASGDSPAREALPLPGRLLVILIAVLVYAIAFVAGYPTIGRLAGMVAMLPILLAAHYFGVVGGLASGVLAALSNTGLLLLVGETELVSAGRIVTAVVLVVFGVASGVIRDLAARGRRSQELLDIAFEAAQDGLWDYRLDPERVYFSPRWFTMLGYEPDELEHSVATWTSLIHEDDRESAIATVDKVAREGRPSFAMSIRMREKSGDWRWILARGKVVERDEHGAARRLVGTHSDISALKQAEDELVHLAYHDQLTDLPNRRALMERAAQLIGRIGRTPGPHLGAVLLLDLDSFQDVNDSFGHDVGDALLEQAARRLQEIIRHTDALYRLGGDEFAVLLTEMTHDTDAGVVASKLIKAFADPFVIADHTIYTAFSVGIAVYPRDGEEVAELLRKADTALYRSKRERTGYRFYTLRMQEEAVAKMSTVNGLRRALDEEHFSLRYQPIVDVTGRIVGAEALLRWNDPEHGIRSPALFVPVAEESALILRIGRWVLARAAVEAEGWRRAGLGDLGVSVNVSARQLRHASMLDDVDLALATSDLPPHLLTLELTESSLIDPTDESSGRLQALRERGVSIAIDDFGTGYSSMSYLKRLPVDSLKIDRSFVVGLPHVREDVAIVEATIGMAHGLGLRVVAEGVDDPRQVDHLVELDCDHFQGYYFSRPLEAAALRELVAANLGAGLLERAHDAH